MVNGSCSFCVKDKWDQYGQDRLLHSGLCIMVASLRAFIAHGDTGVRTPEP